MLAPCSPAAPAPPARRSSPALAGAVPSPSARALLRLTPSAPAAAWRGCPRARPCWRRDARAFARLLLCGCRCTTVARPAACCLAAAPLLTATAAAEPCYCLLATAISCYYCRCIATAVAAVSLIATAAVCWSLWLVAARLFAEETTDETEP